MTVAAVPFVAGTFRAREIRGVLLQTFRGPGPWIVLADLAAVAFPSVGQSRQRMLAGIPRAPQVELWDGVHAVVPPDAVRAWLKVCHEHPLHFRPSDWLEIETLLNAAQRRGLTR